MEAVDVLLPAPQQEQAVREEQQQRDLLVAMAMLHQHLLNEMAVVAVVPELPEETLLLYLRATAVMEQPPIHLGAWLLVSVRIFPE
jgi:hypothetical protein